MYHTFISIPSSELKCTEYYFNQYCKYSQVVFVSDEKLKSFDFYVLGIYPGCLNPKGNEVAGYPKFVYALYYNPDYLFLAEDMLEYCNRKIKFEDIRTARMMKDNQNDKSSTL